MKISKRLKTITEMTEECDCLCDIGTDHAYVPISLILNKRINRAIASDVRKGPCNKARKNISEHDCSDKIEVRTGNGFERIKHNECDTAVIAGMGGYLMTDILKEAHDLVKTFKQLILQPQNGINYVREYLYNSGFNINNERLVYEDEKYYVVLSAVYSGNETEYDKINCYIGKKLLENKDILLKSYLESEIERHGRILERTDKEESKWLLAEYKKMKEKVEG